MIIREKFGKMGSAVLKEKYVENFTLLKPEQVRGDEKLSFFNKISYAAKPSDFACATGAFTLYNQKLDMVSASYWLGANLKDYVYCNGADLALSLKDATYRRYGIRPVVRYSMIKDACKEPYLNENGVLETVYGQFVDKLVSDLETYNSFMKEYYVNNLLKTDKTYTVDSVPYWKENTSFQPKEFDEYLFNGKKYIVFNTDKNTYYRLPSGLVIFKDKDYLFSVSDILWLVDIDTDWAVCKDVLLAGIQYNNGICDDDFNKNNVAMYLNSYFSKDIIPSYVSCDMEKKSFVRKR